MSYSGKKKRHTNKFLVVIDGKTKAVICLAYAKGRTHDFNLFKKSRLPLLKEILARTDSGFSGIEKYHSNTAIPQKATWRHKLTPEQKSRNREVSRKRVWNEIVIGRLKKNRILSERYRGRGKKLGLRFNLIASVYNLQILA